MDNINHKNLELLRYYVSRDLRHIEDKISTDSNEMVGYLAASIVDILIVKLFEDYLSSLSVVHKVLSIIGFVLVFFLVSRIANHIRSCFRMQWKASGRDNEKPDEIRRVIDSFDNIATDGLLLCSYYLNWADETAEASMQAFYLFEAIHYLTKSCSVYRKIEENYDNYVSTSDYELISEYRIENYLTIANELCGRIEGKITQSNDSGLVNHINNIRVDINHWKNQLTEPNTFLGVGDKSADDKT